MYCYYIIWMNFQVFYLLQFSLEFVKLDFWILCFRVIEISENRIDNVPALSCQYGFCHYFLQSEP